MDSSSINPISETFIKPKYEVEESNHPYHLDPMGLALLSFHNIQIGLLFNKPSHLNDQEFSINSFLEGLKESLSLTLVHFYPLAGQLVTEVDEDNHECRVYVDCNKGPGARFIHAAALDLKVYDILSPKDIPLVVRSFFNLNEEAVNYDGHTKPLLAVQVTELQDGVFIACSINHSITDGTSYWHFWNRWSEIHQTNNENKICVESRLPIHKCSLPERGQNHPPITLPFTHPNEFITKFEAPPLRNKMIHFSSGSIATLKSKAIKENTNNENPISSFQALCAFLWRSIVKANRLPHNQVISTQLLANTRHRLNPPLPEFYFGNSIKALPITTTAGELLENNLGWVASLIHESVSGLSDELVREFINDWIESPYCLHHVEVFNCNTIAIQQSPRYDMYGNEFGLGKALAVRRGYGNKAVGAVYACPGYEGGGSVDFEVSLSPDSMNALELDQEFMAFVSSPFG